MTNEENHPIEIEVPEQDVKAAREVGELIGVSFEEIFKQMIIHKLNIDGKYDKLIYVRATESILYMCNRLAINKYDVVSREEALKFEPKLGCDVRFDTEEIEDIFAEYFITSLYDAINADDCTNKPIDKFLDVPKCDPLSDEEKDYINTVILFIKMCCSPYRIFGDIFELTEFQFELWKKFFNDNALFIQDNEGDLDNGITGHYVVNDDGSFSPKAFGIADIFGVNPDD